MVECSINVAFDQQPQSVGPGIKNPHSVYINFSDDFALGTRSIAAYLGKHGYTCDLVFMKRHNADNYFLEDRNYAELLKLLDRLQPTVVGLSVSTKVLVYAEEASRKIRAAFPDVTLLWGGWHPSMNPQRVLEAVDIDGVGVGECEDTVLEVLRRIESGLDLSNCAGLWTRQNKVIVPMGQRPLIAKLDDIPYFRYGDRESFLIEDSIQPFTDLTTGYGADRYGYAIMTSRGCPYSCSFCSVPYLKKLYGNKGETKYSLRRRSIESVIAELEYARDELKANFIWFFDEEFLFHRPWVREFLTAYRDRIGMNFYCEFHPDGLRDPELIDLLADAGLKELEIGLQSASQKTLEIYNRPHKTPRRLVELSGHLASKDITVSYDIILDNPLETDADVRETLEYLLSLSRPFRVSMYPLAFRDNYPLAVNALEQGWITEADLETDTLERRKVETGSVHQEGKVGEFPFVQLNHLNCLIYLSQVDYLPKSWIRAWSQWQILERHPGSLRWLVMFLHRTRLAHTRTILRRIKRFALAKMGLSKQRPSQVKPA